MMANIRVKQALDRIGRDMRRVREFIQYHHGVPREDALLTDNEATAIAVEAAAISAMARHAMGNRSAGKVVKRVRKALGYTYP
jgi:hypothetical protein